MGLFTYTNDIPLHSSFFYSTYSICICFAHLWTLGTSFQVFCFVFIWRIEVKLTWCGPIWNGWSKSRFTLMSPWHLVPPPEHRPVCVRQLWNGCGVDLSPFLVARSDGELCSTGGLFSWCPQNWRGTICQFHPHLFPSNPPLPSANLHHPSPHFTIAGARPHVNHHPYICQIPSLSLIRFPISVSRDSFFSKCMQKATRLLNIKY